MLWYLFCNFLWEEDYQLYLGSRLDASVPSAPPLFRHSNQPITTITAKLPIETDTVL